MKTLILALSLIMAQTASAASALNCEFAYDQTSKFLFSADEIKAEKIAGELQMTFVDDNGFQSRVAFIPTSSSIVEGVSVQFAALDALNKEFSVTGSYDASQKNYKSVMRATNRKTGETLDFSGICSLR